MPLIQGCLYFKLDPLAVANYDKASDLVWSPVVKLIVDFLLTSYIVLVRSKGSTVHSRD